MRKIIIFLFSIFICLTFLFPCTYAFEITDEMEKDINNEFNIDAFLNNIKTYGTEIFPELEEQNIIEKVVKGDAFSSKNIFEKIINIFTIEIKSALHLIFTIIAVSILCSILKSIQSSFGGSVSEIAFYVCYLFIVILIINSYTEIISICTTTITKLNDFMNLLIPLILALLTANGSITSVGVMKPVLLVMTTVINVLVSKVILPIIFISTMINLVSNISENIDISRFPKFLQKTCVWCLELVLAIFIGVLSLEGTLAANVDGITAKTAKTVVSTVIPVVGKALSDAADSLIGATSITKNAVGVIGVVVILAITLTPIIKVLIVMITYNLAAAFVEPFVDKRISKCMTRNG